MTEHTITLFIHVPVVDGVFECYVAYHNKAVIIKSNLFSTTTFITAQIPEINYLNLVSENLKRDELLKYTLNKYVACGQDL